MVARLLKLVNLIQAYCTMGALILLRRESHSTQSKLCAIATMALGSSSILLISGVIQLHVIIWKANQYYDHVLSLLAALGSGDVRHETLAARFSREFFMIPSTISIFSNCGLSVYSGHSLALPMTLLHVEAKINVET